MKKVALLLTLALVLLSVLPLVSFAANETNMNTTITYTKDEPETSEPETPSTPSPGTYEISIPASLSLNEGNELYITSNYMNLDDGKTVVVYIDGKSYEGNYIWLTNAGPDKIGIELHRLNTITSQVEVVGQGSPVAFFDNSGTTPTVYGLLYVHAFSGDIDNARPGTYSGTIYFDISVIN